MFAFWGWGCQGLCRSLRDSLWQYKILQSMFEGEGLVAKGTGNTKAISRISQGQRVLEKNKTRASYIQSSLNCIFDPKNHLRI